MYYPCNLLFSCTFKLLDAEMEVDNLYVLLVTLWRFATKSARCSSISKDPYFTTRCECD